MIMIEEKKVMKQNPSLTTIHGRLSELRSRLISLSSRLEQTHETMPIECDKNTPSVQGTLPVTIMSIHDKVESLEFYMKRAENALDKIVG